MVKIEVITISIKKPRKDLTGKKFGNLTPIEYVGNGKWNCRCDCGNYNIIRTGDLNRGKIKGCGCLIHKDRFDDLSGSKFNNLTAIKFCYRKGVNNKPYFLCKCDCGNYIEVRGSHLTSGDVKSCGCLLRKIKGNNYISKENITEIIINDKTALIDSEDIELVNKHSWHITSAGYVASTSKNKCELIHRIVMGVDRYEDSIVIDHINHNPLDNRKSNLRICTQSQNIFYSKISKANKSGITGVYENENGTWSARIMVNLEDINLGTYGNKNDAIKARKKAEELYFKGFTNDDFKCNVEQ